MSVSAASLAALRSLRDAYPTISKRTQTSANVNGLLDSFDTSPPAGCSNNSNTCATYSDSNGSNDDTLTAYWSAAAAFDGEGVITGLDLGGCRLRSLDPSVLAGIKSSLVTLNLANTDLPISETRDAVSQLDKLEVLCLGGNGIRDESMDIVADIIKTCPCLTRIDMRYNDIGPIGAKVLSRAIVENEKARIGREAADGSVGLTVLHLEGNKIGDEGCQYLASALSSATCSISELYLGDNSIGPEGATHLARALETNNTSLEKLFLEGNRIGPDGASALTDALESLWAKARMDGEEEEEKIADQDEGRTREGVSIALQHLYLDNNGVGKEGMQRLAKALKSSTTIGEGFGW